MADIFNTLEASEKLRKAGFDEGQSKALTLLLNRAISGSVATKEQLDKVESSLSFRIEEVNTKLNARIDGLETKLNARIDGLETRIDGLGTRMDALEKSLKAEMGAVVNKSLVKSMVFQVALFGLLLAILKYF